MVSETAPGDEVDRAVAVPADIERARLGTFGPVMPAASASPQVARASWARRSSYGLALTATVAASIAPFLWIEYPPLVDYPNHLARTYVLLHLDDVPQFRELFVTSIAPVPNVAMDLAMLGLLRVLPPLVAGRCFLALVVILWAVGCHLLGREICGRPTWMALPATLTVFASPFLYGFVNYIAGVALGLCTLGAWLGWRRSWSWARLAAVAALATAVYLSHLAAFGFVAVVIGTTTMMAALARRRDGAGVARDLLPLLPSLVLFIVYVDGDGSLGGIVWNDAHGKLVAALAAVRTYDRRVDLVLIGGVACWAALAARPSVRRDWHGDMWPAVACLLALFLLAPKQMFTAGAVDARFVLPAWVLALLSFDARSLTGRAGRLMWAMLLLLAIRFALIVERWGSLQPDIERAVALLDRLPAGARVFPIFESSEAPDEEKRARTLEHVVQYAVIRRHATTPTLFAIRGQQPLVYRQATGMELGGVRRLPPRIVTRLGFDWVWIWQRPGVTWSGEGDCGVVIGRASQFTLVELAGCRGR